MPTIVAKEGEPDGPSMEQYIETRLNLLTVLINKLEASVRERVDAVERSSEIRFGHVTEVSRIYKATTDASISENKSAQAAVNVAQNAWRDTVNDFKRDTVTRAEFDRLDKSMQEGNQRFEAYRLEVAQTIQARQIKESAITEGSRGTRIDTRSNVTALVGWAVGAAAVASFIFNVATTLLHPTAPPSTAASERRVDDMVERMNALAARINQAPPPK